MTVSGWSRWRSAEHSPEMVISEFSSLFLLLYTNHFFFKLRQNVLAFRELCNITGNSWFISRF